MQLGDAMVILIVHLVSMNKIVQVLRLLPKNLPHCQNFQILLNVMNGLLNVIMVNVFHIGGNVMVQKTVLTKVMNLNAMI